MFCNLGEQLHDKKIVVYATLIKCIRSFVLSLFSDTEFDLNNPELVYFIT